MKDKTGGSAHCKPSGVSRQAGASSPVGRGMHRTPRHFAPSEAADFGDLGRGYLVPHTMDNPPNKSFWPGYVELDGSDRYHLAYWDDGRWCAARPNAPSLPIIRWLHVSLDWNGTTGPLPLPHCRHRE